MKNDKNHFIHTIDENERFLASNELVDICSKILDCFGFSLDMPNGPDRPLSIVKTYLNAPFKRRIDYASDGFIANAIFSNIVDLFDHLTSEHVDDIFFIKQFVYVDDDCVEYRCNNSFLGCTSIDEINIRIDLLKTNTNE